MQMEPGDTPKPTSPCEDANVWSDLLRDLTAGCFVTTRVDIERELGRTPSDEEVGILAKQKVGTYLWVLQDSFEPRYTKRAKRTFRLSKSLVTTMSTLRGGIHG